MFALSKFIPKLLVGIDIHPEEVRLVQLREIKKKIFVEHATVYPLEQGTIVDGKIANFKTLQMALRAISISSQTVGCAVAIALPIKYVFTKRIQLEKPYQKKLKKKEVHANLGSYFPEVKDALFCDYVMLDTLHAQEAFIIAVLYDQLKEYVRVVQEADLKVKIVDVDLFALSRAMQLYLTHFIALLDIDSSCAHFIVFQQGEVIFRHHWDIDQNSNKLEIVRQLKNVIQICLSIHRHIEMNLLFLAGKQDAFSELILLIQSECMLKTQIVNPFFCFDLASNLLRNEISQIAPRMSVSLGLALRRAV